MRYLGFYGTNGDQNFHQGGWKDCCAGGEDLIEVTGETETVARVNFDAMCPEAKKFAGVWWHVADTELGVIVKEGGFRSDDRVVASPTHWLVRK